MKRARLKVVQSDDDGMALLTDVAPGTASLVAVTGGITTVDLHLAVGEIYRADAILDTFIESLGEDAGNERYVLWTVQAILKDAVKIINAGPPG